MKIVRIVIAIPVLLVFAACANMQLGTGGSMVAGSAGAGGAASGGARELQRFNRPVGATAFVPGGYVLGQVAGSLSFKEAQAMLMVTDTRTGVQVGVAEGSAKATDLGGGGGLGHLRGFSSLGGYSNTNEGKVVAGAFLDAFNKLVDQLRKG